MFLEQFEGLPSVSLPPVEYIQLFTTVFRIRIRIQSGQWIRIRIRNPDPGKIDKVVLHFFQCFLAVNFFSFCSSKP